MKKQLILGILVAAVLVFSMVAIPSLSKKGGVPEGKGHGRPDVMVEGDPYIDARGNARFIELQNKDVDYASYMTDHPESNKRRLYIRVKNGKPEDALKKAVKYLEDEVKTFSKTLKGKSKSKK